MSIPIEDIRRALELMATPSRRPSERHEEAGAGRSTFPPRQCAHCAAWYEPTQEHQRFCCPEHRKAAWQASRTRLSRRMEAALRQARDVIDEVLQEGESRGLRPGPQ